MSGAIFFHLFTPLGIQMPEFNAAGEIVGYDGGLLFWVGRARGNVCLSADSIIFTRCQTWFEQATNRARKLGEIDYSKSQKFQCQAVIYQNKQKGRIAKKKRGGKSQCTTDKYQQAKAIEPWLLVYNLPENEKVNATKVVKLYAKRMQIEEAFRDTKNGKLGLGLEYANSKEQNVMTI